MTLFAMSIFANRLFSRELCGYISVYLPIKMCIMCYNGTVRGNDGSTLQISYIIMSTQYNSQKPSGSFRVKACYETNYI